MTRLFRLLHDDGVQGIVIAAIMVGALFCEPLFYLGAAATVAMLFVPPKMSGEHHD